MTLWICATCAVEYPDSETPPQRCPICEDERQYVPRTGQTWTTNDELTASGHRLVVAEREPDLFTITTQPGVGIGQHAVLARTTAGNLLWDPTGFVDDDGLRRVRELGGAEFIVASHPHMFGTQLAWSDALGGARVLVAEKDREWLQRSGGAIQFWDGERDLLPGVTVRTVDSAREATEGADILVTVTTARTPVVEGAWLSPGMHCNVVGAHYPDAREIDSLAVRRSRVVVDDLDQAWGEKGELLIPLAAGEIGRDHVVGDLGAVLTGRCVGRTADSDITMFCSGGTALEYVGVCAMLYERARAAGAGQRLDTEGVPC